MVLETCGLMKGSVADPAAGWLDMTLEVLGAARTAGRFE